MISPESRSIEWIKSVAEENNAHHLTLVEKVIRAGGVMRNWNTGIGEKRMEAEQ